MESGGALAFKEVLKDAELDPIPSAILRWVGARMDSERVGEVGLLAVLGGDWRPIPGCWELAERRAGQLHGGIDRCLLAPIFEVGAVVA